MKKFCSKCGSQLDLGKRACTTCQAFNPYFISGYTNPSQTESVNKIQIHEGLVETKSIPEQKETARILQQVEQERISLKLENELIKVKEETEQYKKETLDLVKGVQKELQDIEKENKLLKEKFDSLKTNAISAQAEVIATNPPVTEHKSDSKKGITAFAAIALLLLVTGLSYSYFKNSNKPNASQPTTTPVTSDDGIKKSDIASLKSDTPYYQKKLAVATLPVATKPIATTPFTAITIPAKPLTITAAPTPAPAVAAAKPVSTPFALTETRVKSDMVGKKLSGCDITIHSASEIDNLSNLVLVEKLSASYLKYKCTIKIKQGADVFTSTPYIYYSGEGSFIKVDGTNCE